MIPIIEPILAGLCVSLINKFVLNNHDTMIWSWCSPQDIVTGHEDDISSANTTISDMSFDTPHIHMH